MTYMGFREKALIAKTAFVAFAAVVSVPLTFGRNTYLTSTDCRIREHMFGD